MNKIQKRIHQFLARQHVITKDLAIRFLADSNLHAIRFIKSDTDPDYAQNEEFTITKKSGGFAITHEISRRDFFYGTETEIIRSFTRSVKHVKAMFNNLLDLDADEMTITNQHGRKADLRIVRIADK